MHNVRSTTVLTIDDEEIICRTIRDFFVDHDYEALEAEDGEAGIEVFERDKPGLILDDLRMPKVNGLEVLDHVTKNSPDTPIIVVSGTGTISDAIEALHLGA